MKRIIIDFAAFNIGNPGIKQRRQTPYQARLGLASLPQENHVLASQDSVLHLWNHGLFKAKDARKERLSL